VTPPTIAQVLAQSGLVPIDAQVLLAFALQRDRAWLVAHGTRALSPGEAERFFILAKRRRDGEPVAYLTGIREFWGLSLIVTPNVLIPRPETETVVEQALKRVRDEGPVRILELGTGSGAIALALARERRSADIVATDVSEPALRVARANARRLGVFNVQFVLADWYAELDPASPMFDLIVSNPPYIGATDRHLGQGDVRFEPRVALTPGGDGLSSLATIVAGARQRLLPGGFLLVEHGYDQAERVRAMFAAAGFTDIESARDLAGISRVVGGRSG
jgi:release factor glutamine methyltransferase